MAKLTLVVGASFGLLAVILGAFGAHALRNKLADSLLAAYQTGVQYQFYHAFALLVVGILLSLYPNVSLLKWSAQAFAIGVILFSGSLYLLALTEWRWLGPVTPLGGLAFIVGWVLLLVAVTKLNG